MLPIRPGTGHLAGWDPDGKAFYYQASGSRAIFRREIQSGTETRFPLPTNALGAAYSEGSPAKLSPDAQQIAFKWPYLGTNSQAIYVMALSGGAPRQLVSVAPPEHINGFDIVWTPDNRYLMFMMEIWEGSKWKSKSLIRVPAAGGEPEKLGDLMDGVSDLRLSPDGQRLAFTVSKSKRDIWVMENFLPAQKAAKK